MQPIEGVQIGFDEDGPEHRRQGVSARIGLRFGLEVDYETIVMVSTAGLAGWLRQL